MAAMAYGVQSARALGFFSANAQSLSQPHEVARAAAVSWVGSAGICSTFPIGRNIFATGGQPISQQFDAKPRQVSSISYLLQG